MDSWSITTWNVNSLRARLPRVQAWIERVRPDVLCLQETKCSDEAFPRQELEALGYHVAFSGEESGLNGVAILSQQPLEDVVQLLPGRDDDMQRRFLSARVGDTRVINVYVPNGQQLGSDAFFFKLDWLSRLQAHLRESCDPNQPLVLLGDFNITPDDRDVWNPASHKGQLACSDIERKMLTYLQAWGLADTLRLQTDEGGIFTWFDYRKTTRSLNREEGMRIDMVYATQPLQERFVDLSIDWEERAGSKPSDHAPVSASFRCE